MVAQSNYRSVSNLSFISKILRRVVRWQLIAYLETNDMMSKELVCMSTPTIHRVCTHHKVFSERSVLDSKNITFLLQLVDMSAAFDCVDHEILLRRLNVLYGFDATVYSWLSSYLAERTHSVKFNGKSTLPKPLGSVFVPQGSVLGPL